MSKSSNNEKVTLESYIADCDEDDLGYLFDWRNDNMLRFVAAANTYVPEALKPQWITTNHGQMTVDTLKRDIIDHLAANGSGASFGDVFVGPNVRNDHNHVIVELSRMETDPYVQAVMAVVEKEGASDHLAGPFYFARISLFSEKKMIRFHWSPPDPRYLSLFS